MTENYTNGQHPEPEIELLEEDFAEDPGEEQASFNQLHDLANQVQRQGLIAGHGYAKGQYEIIREGKIILLPINEAMDYLQKLMGEL